MSSAWNSSPCEDSAVDRMISRSPVWGLSMMVPGLITRLPSQHRPEHRFDAIVAIPNFAGGDDLVTGMRKYCDAAVELVRVLGRHVLLHLRLPLLERREVDAHDHSTSYLVGTIRCELFGGRR